MARYQQALIIPQPWTGNQPNTDSARAVDSKSYPTRLTVPSTLGLAKLNHRTNCYVLHTHSGPFVVGIVREVPRKRKPFNVIIL